MQTFWTQIFILPKKVLRELESYCRIFLWTGKLSPSKKALVAWQHLSLPKVSEGWNIILITLWNMVAITKLLWDLANKADKLWVRWVHTYYIKR